MQPVSRMERRHRFRVQTEIPVKWAWPDRPGTSTTGTVLDISSAGARLVSAECPQVGEVVAITLSLTDPKMELVTYARVVRIADLTQPYHSIWAVAFQDLDLEHQARLARFVFCEAARRRRLSPDDDGFGESPIVEPGEQRVARLAEHGPAHLAERRDSGSGEQHSARHRWYS
jgi:c-di-GMP-binding flagellar brake protein YcgR